MRHNSLLPVTSVKYECDLTDLNSFVQNQYCLQRKNIDRDPVSISDKTSYCTISKLRDLYLELNGRLKIWQDLGCSAPWVELWAVLVDVLADFGNSMFSLFVTFKLIVA